MKFNEHLIELRRQKGLSQEQLGEEIGVTRQTVSKWELGSTTPELDKLIQLAEFFELSIDRLVGREEEENTAVAPTVPSYGWHYEYQSRRSILGLPLVHINIGHGQMYRAKGIVAVGNIAKGLVALGGISIGLLSMGAISVGLLAFGALTVGLLLAVGGISVGTIAIGGLAVGVLAVGGGAVGTYAIGGGAVAAKIAMGGYAQAPIAIGDAVNGEITFYTGEPISAQQVKAVILDQYPQTWQVIVDLFAAIK